MKLYFRLKYVFWKSIGSRKLNLEMFFTKVVMKLLKIVYNNIRNIKKGCDK